MSNLQRRDFLAGAAGLGASAVLLATRTAEAGDPSFMNNIPDPLLSGKALPPNGVVAARTPLTWEPSYPAGKESAHGRYAKEDNRSHPAPAAAESQAKSCREMRKCLAL